MTSPKSKADELRELFAAYDASSLGEGLKNARRIETWAMHQVFSNLRDLLAEIEDLRFSDPASLITSLELRHNADVAKIAELRAVIQRVGNLPRYRVIHREKYGEAVASKDGLYIFTKDLDAALTPKPLDEGGK
jgi:hypothetical protein